MSENEAPALDEIEDDLPSMTVEAVAPAAPAAPQIGVADQVAHTAQAKRMRALLAAEPKVRIRISRELFGAETVYRVNGFRLGIQNGISVEVPASVADYLASVGRI